MRLIKQVRYLFSNAQRLSEQAEFKRVFVDTAKRVKSDKLGLYVSPNALSTARLGLVVSKKNAPKAVLRSRIKRAIRESFRLKQHELAGFDIVAMAYKGLAALDKQQLNLYLDEQWRRLIKQSKQRQCG